MKLTGKIYIYYLKINQLRQIGTKEVEESSAGFEKHHVTLTPRKVMSIYKGSKAKGF